MGEEIKEIFYDWWADNEHALKNGYCGDVDALHERFLASIEKPKLFLAFCIAEGLTAQETEAISAVLSGFRDSTLAATAVLAVAKGAPCPAEPQSSVDLSPGSNSKSEGLSSRLGEDRGSPETLSTRHSTTLKSPYLGEVTRKMAEAGADALSGYDDGYMTSREEWAATVFRAMAKAMKSPPLVEVSAEMIEAGITELIDYSPADGLAAATVEAIYLAMQRARPKRPYNCVKRFMVRSNGKTETE